MDIVVCGKIIPASTVAVEIDPATRRMIRKGVAHELDPAAASAGTVTLVTMGFNEITIGIRTALAMGATSAVHIFDDALAGSDALATAKALAAAIRKKPFDLIICGTESSDSYSGIVPGQLARLLGVPPVTFANEMTVEGTTLAIKRQTETGYDVVEADLPALVTVTSGINEPRYPKLKGIMAAKRKEILQCSVEDLGLAPDDVGERGAREKVLEIGRPPQREAGDVVEDDGEGGKRIADFLAEVKVL